MQAVESVRLCPGQPLQHLCHLGDPQRAGAHDRKQRRHRDRIVALYEDCLATQEAAGEQYEREEAQDASRAVVERLLGRLDGRERRILEFRHGIGGIPEQSLNEIGRDLGISKERVRQIEQSAHAKLRHLAHLEAIVPSAL